MVMYSRNPPEPIFAALGDPTRARMVKLLARGDRTVSALAAEFPITLPATLKHLRVLERAGVVQREKVGRTVTMRLDNEQLHGAELWLRQTRLFWTGQLGRLAASLEDRDA